MKSADFDGVGDAPCDWELLGTYAKSWRWWLRLAAWLFAGKGRTIEVGVGREIMQGNSPFRLARGNGRLIQIS